MLTSLLRLQDPWLTEDLWHAMGPLWCYGPRSFPDSNLSSLVPDDALAARLYASASSRPLTDPAYSLVHNTGLLADAHRELGSKSRVLGLQGTHDACYGGMRDLFARLEGLGKEVVEAELIVVSGIEGDDQHSARTILTALRRPGTRPLPRLPPRHHDARGTAGVEAHL